jgi:uncharacterized protein
MFDGALGQWLAARSPLWLVLLFAVGTGVYLLVFPRDLGSVARAASDVSVSDRAGVLSNTTEQALTNRLQQLEQESGPEVAVVTVESLQGDSIELFSRNLANSMSLGDPARKDGVLVLVAPTDKKVRIEVGRGLEKVLSDSISARIIREDMLPRFRRGDIDGGTRTGVESVASALATFPTKAPQ